MSNFRLSGTLTLASLASFGAFGPIACHASDAAPPPVAPAAAASSAPALVSFASVPVDGSTTAASDGNPADAGPAAVSLIDDDGSVPLRPIPEGAHPAAGLPGCVLADNGDLTCDSLFSWHLTGCWTPDLTVAGKVLLLCSVQGNAPRPPGRTFDIANNGCMFRADRVAIAPDPTSPHRVVALTSRHELAAYIDMKRPSDALAYALIVEPSAQKIRDGVRSTASGKGPFSLSLVMYQVCGCTHPTEQVAVTVTKDGVVTEGRRHLLKSSSGMCVD